MYFIYSYHLGGFAIGKKIPIIFSLFLNNISSTITPWKLAETLKTKWHLETTIQNLQLEQHSSSCGLEAVFKWSQDLIFENDSEIEKKANKA